MLNRKERYNNPANSRLEIFIEYEVPGIDKKIVVTTYSPNGKSQTCTYTSKNTYDKLGRIKKKTVERDCDSTGGESNVPYFRKYSYQYTNGLLINRTGSDRSDGDDRWCLGQLFDYKFW